VTKAADMSFGISKGFLLRFRVRCDDLRQSAFNRLTGNQAIGCFLYTGQGGTTACSTQPDMQTNKETPRLNFSLDALTYSGERGV
jgi:hypothetical protein